MYPDRFWSGRSQDTSRCVWEINIHDLHRPNVPCIVHNARSVFTMSHFPTWTVTYIRVFDNRDDAFRRHQRDTERVHDTAVLCETNTELQSFLEPSFVRRKPVAVRGRQQTRSLREVFKRVQEEFKRLTSCL